MPNSLRNFFGGSLFETLETFQETQIPFDHFVKEPHWEGQAGHFQG